MSFSTDLFAQMVTDLKAATINSDKIFTDVFPSYKDVPAQALYSLPSAVIGYEGGTTDDEHRELGTDMVSLDCYFRDYAHAGKDQLVGDQGAQAVLDYLRESYSYRAGDAYGVSLELKNFTIPVELKVQGKTKRMSIWTFRATYEVTRG